MAITIKQIASAAGVSRGTVDRALNNRDGINPDVKKKILDIAQKLNYSPNPAAKALSIGKNIVIGVMLPCIDNPFFDEVLRGIDDATNEFKHFGITVIIEKLKGYNEKAHLTAIKKLTNGNIDALIVATVNSKEIVAHINSLEIPVIAINSDLPDVNKLCLIGNDYIKSGKTVAGLFNKFFNEEKTRVLIITGSSKMIGHNQRISGFQEMINTQYHNITITAIYENNDDDDKSYEILSKLDTDNFDAVYLTAGGVIGAIIALDSHNSEKRIKVIAHDISEKTSHYLVDDKIDALITQDPYTQGYLPIKNVYNFYFGQKELISSLLTDTKILIKENL